MTSSIPIPSRGFFFENFFFTSRWIRTPNLSTARHARCPIHTTNSTLTYLTSQNLHVVSPLDGCSPFSLVHKSKHNSFHTKRILLKINTPIVHLLFFFCSFYTHFTFLSLFPASLFCSAILRFLIVSTASSTITLATTCAYVFLRLTPAKKKKFKKNFFSHSSN